MPLGGGAPLVDTTIYGWQGYPQPPADGISPAYGWFANQEIPELAIDNTLIKDFDTLTLSPTNPPPLGLGTIQTFILSASLFGTPDPLTPGLAPANVNFTQGGTGSVTVVPSGTQPNNGTFSFDATGATDGSVNLTANLDIFPSNTASFNVIQPSLYSPANGSTLTGSSVTFYWTEYPGATNYWLDLGSTQYGNNYEQTGSLSSSTLSYTVNNLPTDGSTVWATWWYYVSGSWHYSEYSYTASGGGSPKGVITSPPPNSTLTGSTVNFIWTLGSGATNYWIDAGNTPGGNQYFQSGPLGNVNHGTVTGLPTDGSMVYVTLFTYVGGQWLNNQYTYTAFSLSGSGGVITTPPNNSTLTGSTVTFNWTAGAGASAYWLDIGSTAGGSNYYNSGNLGNVLTTTASGLPTDGSTVYATLFSYVGGQWIYNQYQYTAASNSLAVMQTPPPGSVLGGTSATFTWSAGNGANNYWLDIGSTQGGNDYYQSGALGNVLTTTVNTLPANSTTIYVTLWTYVGGQWQYNQYTYFSTLAFQGFETGTGDWADVTGTPGAGIAQVISGGGVLHLTPASGNYYAEITNEYDTYEPGFGYGEYSFFGYATQPPYPGNFSQSVSVYIDVSWPPAIYNGPGFWVDMTPGTPTDNGEQFGGEHNYRMTPTGTSVQVFVDGQGSPLYTITASGWYQFQMTYRKGAQPTDLVSTDMNLFDNSSNLLATTTVLDDSDGYMLLSQDLAGPGYVWITVWADGWPAAGANDVLGLDNARADLLH